MAVVRDNLRIAGGIAYRPFASRKFCEIDFCAINSNEQVKVNLFLALFENFPKSSPPFKVIPTEYRSRSQGYSALLMSHLKDYVMETYDSPHFLTYADKYA